MRSIIMFENEAIGVLAVHDGPDHLLLSEIQICPSHQGRGIGSAIVAGLIERGRKQKISVRLQVLRCSRARALYERLGGCLFIHSWRRRRSWVSVKGVIVGYREDSDAIASLSEVQFRLPNG